MTVAIMAETPVSGDIKSTWRCTLCRAAGSISRSPQQSSDSAVRAVLRAHQAVSPGCEGIEGIRFKLRAKGDTNGIDSTRR